MKRIRWKKRLLSLLLAGLMFFSPLFTGATPVKAANEEENRNNGSEDADAGQAENGAEESADAGQAENVAEENVGVRQTGAGSTDGLSIGQTESSAAESSADPPVSGLRLSQSSLNLETEGTARLYLSIFPEDAVYSEVIWESDDTDVVTVTGEDTEATVTASAVNEGVATVTATVGELSVSCEVLVTQRAPMLESLRFTAYNNSADDAYELSDMDMMKKEYELIVPVTESTVYVWPGLKDGLLDVTVTADYIDRTGDAVHKNLSTTGGYTQLGFLLTRGELTRREITITVTAGTLTEVYTVKVFRGTGLETVEFRSEYGTVLGCTPVFDTETKYYDLYVPAISSSLTVSMTPSEENSTHFYVNGQEVTQESVIENVETLSQIVVGCDTGDETKPREYVFRIRALSVCRATFIASPKDLLLCVYDSRGARVLPDKNGDYILTQGAAYTYTASKAGYVSAKWNINVSEDSEIPVTLEKIPASGELSDLDAEWSGVYKDDANQNVLVSHPADSSVNAVLDWRSDYESLSGIILVDGLICAYDEATLRLIDPETGETVKQAQLSGRGQTGLGNKPIYGAGMIFVQLTNGRIQAFDAFTLNSLWLYANPDGGMLTGGLRYDGGYLYAGYYNSSLGIDNLVCISVEDENPSNDLEEKECTWKYNTSGGYYCTSPYTDETNIYAVSSEGRLLCIDKAAGYLKQSINLGTKGGTAAGISYYQGRIYFTTVNGYVCSCLLTEEGIAEDSLKFLRLGGCSKSTPVIYNGRMYVGYSTGAASAGQPYGVGPYYLAVLEIDSSTGVMSPAYKVQVSSMLNESATLAVSEDGSRIRVYFTVNHGTYAGVYVLYDMAGQTEASAKNEYLKVSEKSTELSTGTVVAAEDGRLYFRTETGSLFSLVRTDLMLSGVSVSDAGAVIDGGSFHTFVKDHEITLGAGVTSTLFTVETAEGIEVSINGKEGASYEVELTDGEADVTVMISNGTESKTYFFHFYEVTDTTALKQLFLSTGTHFETDSSLKSYYPLEELSPETENYTIRYLDKVPTWYLWVVPETGGSSAMVVKPVSGCSTTEKLQAIAFNNHTYYYKFSMSPNSESAEFDIIVTAPDGITTKTYRVTVGRDVTAPTISAAKEPLSNRLADSVDLTFTASEQGALYYLLYDSIPTTLPTTTTYRQSALKAATPVKEGENTITLTGLSKKSQYLYAAMLDGAGNWSPYATPIQVVTGDAPSIPLTGIELGKETLSMETGDTEELAITLLPPGNTEEPKITWSSDNKKVAVVSGNGTTASITAVGGGSANIIVNVSSDGKTYTAICKVSVRIVVTDIRLNAYSLELKIGETADLTAALLPEDADVIPKIIWRNSNKNYVSVNAKGTTATLTALSAGTSVIEVLAGSARIECTVRVLSNEPGPVRNGDVNQDGSVDIFDVALTIDMINGSAEPDLTLADMDDNGYLDIFDAVALVDILRDIS